ncbi:MAG TPA: oxygen-independent coproporphyrinogen III oxidase [Steroidobacteraceae bacterium]
MGSENPAWQPRSAGELLRRYDVAGPRYTSYPTAPQFRPDFGEMQYREHARRSNATFTPRPLSLYVHVPFCASPCFYCGCTRLITRDVAAGTRYVDRLLREAALVAPLFDHHREVRQLHLGGGTPNFLRQVDLTRLINALGGHFHLGPPANLDFSIELDPRFATTADVEHLGRLGFNRASLGVQDFDPRVQQAVNRIQSVEQTLGIIDACRASGFRSINIDLIYGLPYQSLEGFGRTLDTIIEARPDRLAVYGYAHMPRLFKAQRQIESQALPDPAARIALLELAIDRLGAAGYRYIGMDHFARPEDDLARAQDAGGLHRNFMGYTTHAGCELIGLGMSAISHFGGSFSQNHRDLRAWQAAVDAGQLPIWRGLALSGDDRVRADVIQSLMCQGAVDFHDIERRHGVDFESYFAGALQRVAPLVADGIVSLSRRQLRATDRGRFVLRMVAMCFDRYLAPAAAHPGASSGAPPPSATEGAREQRFSSVL